MAPAPGGVAQLQRVAAAAVERHRPGEVVAGPHRVAEVHRVRRVHLVPGVVLGRPAAAVHLSCRVRIRACCVTSLTPSGSPSATWSWRARPNASRSARSASPRPSTCPTSSRCGAGRPDIEATEAAARAADVLETLRALLDDRTVRRHEQQPQSGLGIGERGCDQRRPGPREAAEEAQGWPVQQRDRRARHHPALRRQRRAAASRPVLSACVFKPPRTCCHPRFVAVPSRARAR